jgi:hypothetical protein
VRPVRSRPSASWWRRRAIRSLGLVAWSSGVDVRFVYW